MIEKTARNCSQTPLQISEKQDNVKMKRIDEGILWAKHACFSKKCGEVTNSCLVKK